VIFRRLDHLGIAVRDLEEAGRRWTEDLGFTFLHREVLEEQGVEVLMLDGGNCHVELLAPHGENSPIAKYLERRGEGLQQAAFAVEDMDRALEFLKGRGLLPIAPPSIGAGGRRVCFLHPKNVNGVLLELVEDR
jgi:methylmalonyl-CoA/ethylmalonyl-CoA epimerase